MSKRQIKMEQMNTEVMWSLWRLCTPPSYPLFNSSSFPSSTLRCVKWCNVATTGCNMGGLVKLLLVRQKPSVWTVRTICLCVCGYCATMNGTALRESWLGKWLRQIKHLVCVCVCVNSLLYVHYYTALHETVLMFRCAWVCMCRNNKLLVCVQWCLNE